MTTFRVIPGREAQLIEAWKAAAAAALEFVPGAAVGQLLQDLGNPLRLVALGAWDDVDAVALWRALPEFTSFAALALTLCDEVERYTLDVIGRATREAGP
jgi:heme-degrading monooxygenase HmoA